MGALLGDLSWPEVERHLERGARPVVPIGASAKEHGHHLPMATDWLQAQWLGAALAARHDVLVWPPLSYGHYPAFVAYPGSVSLSEPLFEGCVGDLVVSIQRHSRRPALFVNTGISTIAPLDRALAQTGSGPAERPRAVHVYHGERCTAAVASICEQVHGGHGDEVETSIMLAICPDRVRMPAARAHDRAPAPGPLSRDPGAPGYTPQGVFGNPTAATAAKGRKILEAILADIAQALVEAPVA